MSFGIKRLALAAIRLDDELQPRVELSEELIEEYSEAMERKADFPPVEVTYDGTDYWLWDGFHRYLAAQAVEQETILAHITSGAKQDAIWQSLSANATHGMRRNNKDKAKAICKALKVRSDETDRFIADHVGVSPESVGKYREQMESSGEIEPSPVRVGSDGRKYRREAHSPSLRSLPRYPVVQFGQHSREKEPLPLNPDELWANNTELRVGSAKVREVLAAMSKAGDVAGVYDMVRYVHQMVMRGYEAGHPVYRFLDVDQFIPAMDHVLDSLKEIVPAEVCGFCNGEGCDDCRHRGWVGRAAWERRSGLSKQPTASTELVGEGQEK